MDKQTRDLFDEASGEESHEGSHEEKVSADNTAAPPPAAPPGALDLAGAEALPLDQYAERAYLTYAMSVVTGRALPHVEDGQKPVQRRILYAMHEMGLAAGAKPVKSARVVGDVIGKFHPHGDQSVYDAMVRVAQDFSLRYPLIDGQGNFGSRDDDAPAAMRYTEARLTPFAGLLLDELERGTVDFAPNYDGAFREPQLLPARLPLVLLNGASGIAVGMATEIPPHNLREVAAAAALLIRQPKATLAELLALLPGPDFPGGGQIISAPRDLEEAYRSGRASLRMRARWRVEDLARGQWRVAIHELPHGVSAARVAAEIESLTNPQPRHGRRDLSQEQKNLKQLALSVLDAIRDESNEKEPVRLILEPRSKNQDVQEMMNVLLANTSLETNITVNLTLLGRDGRPQQKDLRQILAEWIDFRFATVTRRTAHRLAEVERRLHILDGRLIAFLHIDQVIQVIRNADEPRAELMARFALSEIQAEDILEIRLRQLARLEGIRIEKERDALREEEKGLRRLLAERREMTRLILKEIEQDAKRHGDARRTLIETVAAVGPTEIPVSDEPVTVILSKNGWVRRRDGHGLDAGAISYKTGDQPFLVAETRTPWPLILIDSSGRAYSLRVADLPGGRGDGAPITTMIGLPAGARVVAALSDAPEASWLFASSAAYGFIARVADLVSRNKSGKAFMSLEAGERVLLPAPVQAETIAAVSTNGRLLLFAVDEMKRQSAGRGVQVMGLEKGEELVAVAVIGESGLLVEGAVRGGRSKPCQVAGKELAKYRLHRARKGALLPVRMKPASLLPVR